MKRALLFGGSGYLGSAIHKHFLEKEWSVDVAPRSINEAFFENSWDAVIWSQGANINDSILDVTLSDLQMCWEANVVYIVKTLSSLLKHNALQRGSRLCFLSSIWQQQTRAHKFSYTVTKSALLGLLHSCATDLAPLGIFINAVLPGVVDSPMTRESLSPDQISHIEAQTPGNHLVTDKEVAQAVYMLCAESPSGLTGQQIVVDRGFSFSRWMQS